MDTTQPLLTDLLRETSRSFYLTLRVLPKTIRRQIGLAYLLARTTDTIADTAIMPLDQRLDALELLRGRILQAHQKPLDFGELAAQQDLAPERMLLERSEEAVMAIEMFNEADQQRIREVLKVITSGQQLDLKRFAGASEKNIVALQNADELDDYTYRVAGCVGEFWTKICRAYEFPGATLDEKTLLAQGVRFGKGLQLVNILRDMPADLRNGRCYLPGNELAAAGLSPADLLDMKNEARFRPVYDRYVALAEAHLAAGWEYTNTLPRRCARVRLACAWPILIGVRTLKLLRAGHVLDPEERIKVSRPEVKKLMARSVFCYPWPGKWRKLVEVAAAVPQG